MSANPFAVFASNGRSRTTTASRVSLPEPIVVDLTDDTPSPVPPPAGRAMNVDGNEEEEEVLWSSKYAEKSLTQQLLGAASGDLGSVSCSPDNNLEAGRVEEVVYHQPMIASAADVEKNATKKIATVYDCDDDDDLMLLVGSKAVPPPPPPPPPPLPTVATTVQTTTHTSVMMGRGSSSTDALPMSQMPWNTKSNEHRRHIIKKFEENFIDLLKTDSDVKKTIAPFLRDKVIRKLPTTDSFPWLPEAPTVTEDTGSLKGNVLRSYQVEGVQFLMNAFHRGMGCILADDMGLGKTAQLCSFLHCLKRFHNITGPHLILAPLSTLSSWMRELARWAPTLHVVKFHGDKRGRNDILLNSPHLTKHAVFVTTPATFLNEKSFFKKRAWVTVTCDEAHILKGDSTKITTQASKIDACFRCAMSGTPVQNNLGELWNFVRFLFPSFADGVGSITDQNVAATQCSRLLKLIMLRRTKASMELGIPKRIDEPTIFLEPTPLQERLMLAMSDRVLAEQMNSKTLLALFVYGRTVCDHPYLLKLLFDGDRDSTKWSEELTGAQIRLARAGIDITEEDLILPSAKMMKLDVLLRSMKVAGDKVLIFSNFTSQLDVLEGMCLLRGYSYERLDGSCTRAERELGMHKFNHPKSKMFVYLISTTAGGVGVTLTGANRVILFDSHYNPQIDRQAADRAHRIGQTREVHVVRFCLKGTIEERVQEVAAQKAQTGDFVIDGVVSDAAKNGRDQSYFSVDEIRALFAEQGSRNSRQLSSCPPASGQHHDESCSNIADEDAEIDETVQELMQVIKDGKLYSEKFDRGGAPTVGVTNECFDCGGKMKPMEPLLHCSSCVKAYHPDCVDGGRQVAKSKQWTCPRHFCGECGKRAQSDDGVIFSCSSCPVSYCFDCLDPRYLELDEKTGTSFKNFSHQYPGMKEEGMGAKRTMIYLTCLSCAGLDDSSSDDNDSGSSTDSFSEME